MMMGVAEAAKVLGHNAITRMSAGLIVRRGSCENDPGTGHAGQEQNSAQIIGN